MAIKVNVKTCTYNKRKLDSQKKINKAQKFYRIE